MGFHINQVIIIENVSGVDHLSRKDRDYGYTTVLERLNDTSRFTLKHKGEYHSVYENAHVTHGDENTFVILLRGDEVVNTYEIV